MKIIFASLSLLLLPFSLLSQSKPTTTLREVKEAFSVFSATHTKEIPEKPVSPVERINSGAAQMISKMSALKKPHTKTRSKNRDTLFVFNDTTITGNWLHDGPIFVLGDGRLRFINAHATILGDIVVWGAHARLEADSSYLYIPQQYFYERSLTVADKGYVRYRHTTLDHSNLSHNLAITDSGHVEMTDVTNLGFTTCGLYANAAISINGTNQAGEFILTDNADLDFTNANTVLLWHQVKPGGVFNKTFPNGSSGVNYQINSSTPGVSGINYHVNLTNCSDVMWGLMPLNNTDITISNSLVRSIGLWFMGSDTIAVNGLVDNSNYTDFTANISDRHLRLVNSSVTTWSLYPMQNTTINISGCILGEIGSMGRSLVNSQSIMVDGSGGYFWAGDTSFIMAWGTSTTSSIRSDKNGIFLYAYSVMTNGEALALGNSILISIQNSLPDDPRPLWGGVAWMQNISRIAPTFADTIVAITGSAWIDRGPMSYLMDFAWYSLYYQKQGDTSWTMIKDRTPFEVRNDTLALWNTYGLLPGAYNIKLLVCDNSADSNTFDAQKSVNLLRDYTADITLHENLNLLISPNPANEEIYFTYHTNQHEPVEITIVDSYGRTVWSTYISDSGHGNIIQTVPVSYLPHGVFFCRIKSSSGLHSGIFLKE